MGTSYDTYTGPFLRFDDVATIAKRDLAFSLDGNHGMYMCRDEYGEDNTFVFYPSKSLGDRHQTYGTRTGGRWVEEITTDIIARETKEFVSKYAKAIENAQAVLGPGKVVWGVLHYVF